ncbi:hypothetical protein FPL14_10100 [Cohnella cholangitidis]|uniref:Carbohydrate binding domain-containing protein n=1 Tax=Cohnella cholangitidis TaxID=2598458 RepID=A0A7G5BX23_9BACL|nr:hypothetical protein [Cohnella cholangitidis]QMV41507.1 hypothetical protein FPL14_10100 [Cohnella cholangitidis]
MRKKISLILAFTVLVTTFLSFPLNANASTPEAPAGWRNLLDYRIFSTTSDGWAGDSGFGLETQNGKLPVDNSVTLNGLPSLKLNTMTVSNPSWYNALITVAGWKAYDFTPYYANGFLEFNIKGKQAENPFCSVLKTGCSKGLPAMKLPQP